MKEQEIERIRKFWNKPPNPTFCAACKKEIPLQRGPAAGMLSVPICPHCGSNDGWTSTFTTGGRDAKLDVNTLLNEVSRLRALVASSSVPQGELNGWRELGEEMTRVIFLMPQETFAEWFPDWFGPRLFDLQVGASRSASSTEGRETKATIPVCGGSRIGWRTKESSCGTALVYEHSANGMDYWRCPACGNPHWWPVVHSETMGYDRTTR